MYRFRPYANDSVVGGGRGRVVLYDTMDGLASWVCYTKPTQSR